MGSPTYCFVTCALLRDLQLQIMTPIRIPYIEKALGISIRTLKGFENGRRKYFASVRVALERYLTPSVVAQTS